MLLNNACILSLYLKFFYINIFFLSRFSTPHVTGRPGTSPKGASGNTFSKFLVFVCIGSTPPVTGRPGTLVCVQCFMNTIEIQEETTWVIMRYVIHYIGLRVLKRSGLKRNIEYCSRTTTRTLIFAKFHHFARYGNIFAVWGSNEEL